MRSFLLSLALIPTLACPAFADGPSCCPWLEMYFAILCSPLGEQTLAPQDPTEESEAVVHEMVTIGSSLWCDLLAGCFRADARHAWAVGEAIREAEKIVAKRPCECVPLRGMLGEVSCVRETTEFAVGLEKWEALNDKLKLTLKPGDAFGTASMQVHLSGPNFSAHCRQMVSGGTDNEIYLVGDVHVECTALGETVTKQAQIVRVRLVDGAVQVLDLDRPVLSFTQGLIEEMLKSQFGSNTESDDGWHRRGFAR